MLASSTLITLLSTLALSSTLVSAKTISPLTYRTDARNHTCQLSLPETACRNATAVQDTCCTAASSLTLYTQYWDTVSPGFGARSVVTRVQGVVDPWERW